MDGRLKARVLVLSTELAPEEQARLGAAGTLVEMEELACEIGDGLVPLTAIAIGLNWFGRVTSGQ